MFETIRLFGDNTYSYKFTSNEVEKDRSNLLEIFLIV